MKQEINDIKIKLLLGLIDYQEAKRLVEPIIKKMNEKGKEIAKKYGQRFRPFTVAKILR